VKCILPRGDLPTDRGKALHAGLVCERQMQLSDSIFGGVLPGSGRSKGIPEAQRCIFVKFRRSPKDLQAPHSAGIDSSVARDILSESRLDMLSMLTEPGHS
jgi:hypothetical protein